MSLVDTDEGMPGIARDVANKQITAPVDHQHALLFCSSLLTGETAFRAAEPPRSMPRPRQHLLVLT
jgi:hypothetical protein